MQKLQPSEKSHYNEQKYVTKQIINEGNNKIKQHFRCLQKQ